MSVWEMLVTPWSGQLWLCSEDWRRRGWGRREVPRFTFRCSSPQTTLCWDALSRDEKSTNNSQIQMWFCGTVPGIFLRHILPRCAMKWDLRICHLMPFELLLPRLPAPPVSRNFQLRDIRRISLSEVIVVGWALYQDKVSKMITSN
ncbi:uncharacterized protein LOC117650861 isoform X2 [Thrips palmi]|uniref:Uncharacterized protein LOC117650861 isoform X2 n=1 Tax=Thrips palmi TaxID=161013 RepID=A0A6P8ZY85_THRPL|nr:uncharacterized protein LOC117650861 isoform X2 [Thrips palmi]